jgi:hypothetical protein
MKTWLLTQDDMYVLVRDYRTGLPVLQETFLLVLLLRNETQFKTNNKFRYFNV